MLREYLNPRLSLNILRREIFFKKRKLILTEEMGLSRDGYKIWVFQDDHDHCGFHFGFRQVSYDSHFVNGHIRG